MDEEEDDTATPPSNVGVGPMSDTDEDDFSAPGRSGARAWWEGDGLPGPLEDGEFSPIDLQPLVLNWTAWCMHFCRIAGGFLIIKIL